MDKLTNEHVTWEGDTLKCCTECCVESDICDPLTCVHMQDVAARLQAYEDSGLTPERVAELAAAEREGRLVVLPCKVGDTVYQALTEWDGTECLKTSFKPKVREREVNYFMFGRSGKLVLEVIDIGGFGATFLIYGETAFLTREEAEAALAAREDERIDEQC